MNSCFGPYIPSQSSISSALTIRDIGRLEEIIAKRVTGYGPLVVLGEPNTLPWPGGAVRDFYVEGEWQAAVISWIDRALLISLVASSTPGLTWELKTVIDRGHLHKALLSLPGGPKQQERWAHICESFHGTTWHPAMVAANTSKALAVHFGRDGSLTVIWSKEWSRSVSEVAIDVAIYGMLCGDDRAALQLRYDV